jgi:nucleoside-diphosphate-sugar epimerase
VSSVFAAAGEGLDAVVVPPPWFYGPYHRHARRRFRMVGRPLPGGRRGRRRTLHGLRRQPRRRAAARGARRSRAGTRYWIADARPYEVTEIVETVGRALRAEGFDDK